MFQVPLERTVSLVGSIDYVAAEKLGEKFIELMRKDPHEWINFLICCHGGSVASALGLYDILTSVLKPRLQTLCAGFAASMAVILFLAGEYRVITAHSTISLHDLGWTFEEKERYSLTRMRKTTEELTLDQNFYSSIISEKTKLSKKEVLKLMEDDIVITPDRAKELDFAHEIV